ncbi:MAG: hypothetical protein CMF69_03080 [Magnetovibrio sp.]|nr:hypothetical protein [Magnetovibrio sp.]|tara:strand:- start:864 stop:1766 length:903 start_codon:yes stop_codon:yes gene_type:complete
MNINKYNFSGFIWGPAKKFTNEILEHINKKFPVLHYYIYDFKNKEDFEKSVLNIYTTDDIDPNKVKNVKIKNMLNHSFSYTYFKFYIEKPNFRKKKATGNDLSRVVEAIKKEIREKYKSKISNYIYDIIIHISDNFEQTKDIDIIMKKYEKHRQHEFINLKYLLKCNFKNDIFNRVDMLVRKYSIEQYLKNPNYKFNFYNKMQKKRTQKNTMKTFIKLIESLKNGFNKNYPILCSMNYKIHNGSHRTAWAYFSNRTFIPIKCMFKSKSADYSIKWFIKHNFSKENIYIINNEIVKLNQYL